MRVIAGSAKRTTLQTVPGLSTRPTTDRIKETLFNMIQDEVPGASFLDLFAGSGAIGIEALSRGAANAVFVEHDRNAAACIRQNLQRTHLDRRATLLMMDYTRALNQLSKAGEAPFSLIFMDPPYQKGLGQSVLTLLDASCKGLADENTLVILEESLTLDPSWVDAFPNWELVRVKQYKTNQHFFLKTGAKSNSIDPRVQL